MRRPAPSGTIPGARRTDRHPRGVRTGELIEGGMMQPGRTMALRCLVALAWCATIGWVAAGCERQEEATADTAGTVENWCMPGESLWNSARKSRPNR